MSSYEEYQSVRIDSRVNLLDYIQVIRKHWRVEVALIVAACLTAGVVSLTSPKEYEATASVLPPADTQGGGLQAALLAQGQGPGPMLGSLLFGTSNKDIFVGILKSRTMLDDVIKKFDLIKVYRLEDSKVPFMSARKKLEKMTDIKVSKEGIISVTTSAYDAKMAADIANFFVDNLDRLNTSLNTTDAGRSRLFLEGRVAEAQKALKEAEERLREYQSRSKAVVLEGQAKAAIEGAATLEGQIVAAEVQLKTLQTYATQRNPDVIRLKESIDEMRRQLRLVGYGKESVGKGGISSGGSESDFSVPLGSIPSTGLDLVRLVREAKMQETIFTLLTQQLEQAKIAEAKDTPTVKILDRAVVPEWKSRPKVLLNTAIAGAASLFFAIILAFFLEFIEGVGRRKGKEELA